MIQGGCPEGSGRGGPGYQIKAEFNDTKHVRGILSMARAQDPNSAGSQFFVCHGDANFLDRNYTAFGRLILGDETLEKIASAPVSAGAGGERSKPAKPVKILKASVTRPK
jgi:peptidyl-prolyl cis-trans isomerase B (cyclophilin B)